MALNSYQQAVVDWSVNGIGSAVVSALAGTGKTFTLEAIVAAVKAAKPEAEIFLGAYNKAIATELQTRMSKNDYGKSVQASTFHSAGLRALSSYLENVKGIKKLTITKGNDKVSGIIDGLRDQCIKAAARAQSDAKADEANEKAMICTNQRGFVIKAVSLAKQRAFGVVEDVNDDAAWVALIEHFGLDQDLDEDYFA